MGSFARPIGIPNSINHMPDELVDKILSYVDNSTLYDCLFASKRISRIAMPLLYRVIHHRMYKQPSKLQSAIRTLITRPELQSKVEAIALREPASNRSFWNLESWATWASLSYSATLSEKDHELFWERARNIGPSWASERDLAQYEEVQAALLISLAPNLTYLRLENPTTQQETPRFSLDHLILTTLYPRIREGLILQNLRTLHAVTFRLEGGQGGSRLSSIATFFLLPKLTKVTCIACFEPEDDLFTPFDCPADTSNVKQIRFIRSSVCPLGIHQMLNACAAVEEFDCDWAGLSVGWVEVNFPLIKDALAKHKHTLRRLRLDTRKHFDSWPERDDGLVPPLARHLQEYTQLRSMDVPASALLGWDENNVGGYEPLENVLPPNLEELKMNDYVPRLVDALDAFIPVVSEKYPKLKLITISRAELEMEENGGAEERLRRRFAELAPDVTVNFEDESEVDHFEGSMGSGSVC